MSNKQVRFGAIHGLRGIAAMGVVLFHLSENLHPELNQLLPEAINVLFAYGFLGVPIFFVISGFVISYGIAAATIDAKYVGNFVLRRSIRLDLTYWASIALALILLALKNQFLGSEDEFPSVGDILLNMFYLQELMEVKPVISVVYWTLCLEVQFYLFYIFSLWCSQKLSSNAFYQLNMAIILALGLYSLGIDVGLIENPLTGLFVMHWHYFLMGVLVCNVIRQQPAALFVFVVFMLIEIGVMFGVKVKEYAVAGVACAIFIFTAWKYNLLDVLFKGRVLTYLGTISYSLYLVHPDIGWKAISFGKKLLGGSIEPWQAGLLLVLGVAISILVAHIFHRLFEQPTQKIAARVKSEPLLSVLRDTFWTKAQSTQSKGGVAS